MAPVTEVVLVPLKPDMDQSTVESKIQALAKATLADPGCQRFRAGRELEDASHQRMFIDWDSLAAHETFMKSESYGPMIQEAMAATAAPPVIYHVALSPWPPAVLTNEEGKGTSAVAELASFYFSGVTDDAMEAVRKETQRFLDLVPGAAGFSGETSFGWSVEEVEFEGAMCRVLLLAIGWESREAHMKFRDTEHFARIIPILTALEGIKGLQICHVSTKSY